MSNQIDNQRPEPQQSIAVVIPCYKVKPHILDVLKKIGPEVSAIYVIDDCCPENSGEFALENTSDERVTLIKKTKNEGVGGATLTGYAAAIKDGHSILVKVDGDDQMDPSLIKFFTDPIKEGEADYTKGNRFYDLTSIKAMPTARIIGNAALSFLSKLSTGYWDIFDPTNGYTAIHANIARHLPFKKISKRYFFESDILFRLNTMRCVVLDIPMDAKYGEEISNLKISSILGEFLWSHIKNGVKRVFYNYFLRDLTAASFHLVLGVAFSAFGSIFGIYHWMISMREGVMTAPGTVMLAALPVIVGLQFLLAFILHDTQSSPKRALNTRLYSARPPDLEIEMNE
jgi:dolichol-phosphate mannosyltransferase